MAATQALNSDTLHALYVGIEWRHATKRPRSSVFDNRNLAIIFKDCRVHFANVGDAVVP
jgi:hypothetical protein